MSGIVVTVSSFQCYFFSLLMLLLCVVNVLSKESELLSCEDNKRKTKNWCVRARERERERKERKKINLERIIKAKTFTNSPRVPFFINYIFRQLVFSFLSLPDLPSLYVTNLWLVISSRKWTVYKKNSRPLVRSKLYVRKTNVAKFPKSLQLRGTFELWKRKTTMLDMYKDIFRLPKVTKLSTTRLLRERRAKKIVELCSLVHFSIGLVQRKKKNKVTGHPRRTSGVMSKESISRPLHGQKENKNL